MAHYNVSTCLSLQVSTKMSDFGGNAQEGYTVSEVFSGQKMGFFKPKDIFKTAVDPSGVFFGRADIMQ